MRPVLLLAPLVVLFALPASREEEPTAAGGDAQVRRGEYLAHRVAHCVQCHSPRDEAGELDRTRLFRGGAVRLDGPDFVDDWAFRAPDLTVLADREPERVVNVLVEGRRPDGTEPSPPMPPFRLERADAEAVVAYLRSLE